MGASSGPGRGNGLLLPLASSQQGAANGEAPLYESVQVLRLGESDCGGVGWPRLTVLLGGLGSQKARGARELVPFFFSEDLGYLFLGDVAWDAVDDTLNPRRAVHDFAKRGEVS